jgi:hypothetical protein
VITKTVQALTEQNEDSWFEIVNIEHPSESDLEDFVDLCESVEILLNGLAFEGHISARTNKINLVIKNVVDGLRTNNAFKK